MCSIFRRWMGSILGTPTRADTVRADYQAAREAEARRPAREADEAREDGGAEVKEDAGSDIVTSNTDVAIKTTKKTSRKGVPGLGL